MDGNGLKWQEWTGIQSNIFFAPFCVSWESKQKILAISAKRNGIDYYGAMALGMKNKANMANPMGTKAESTNPA